jgi:WD40 repeat protein
VRGEGPPLFVTATQNADEVLVWRPSAEEPPTELPNDDIAGIGGVTAAYGHGHPMAAAGGGDGVTVWDLTRGETLASFCTHAEGVLAVSLSRLAESPVVAATVEHDIHVWDLTRDPEDDPIHDPLTGHEETIRSLDTVTFDDRCLAVTGGDDTTVRIWDLRTGTQVGDPLSGHKGSVETVRIAVLDGRHVALSAGRDGRINVWDLQAMAR